MFRWKYNFNSYPQKSQIYPALLGLGTQISSHNHNQKAENPRSDRKLTVRCPDNVDAVRDSIGKSLCRRRDGQEFELDNDLPYRRHKRARLCLVCEAFMQGEN